MIRVLIPFLFCLVIQDIVSAQTPGTTDSSMFTIRPLLLNEIQGFEQETARLINRSDIAINEAEALLQYGPSLEKIFEPIKERLSNIKDTTKIYRYDEIDRETRQISLYLAQLDEFENDILDVNRDIINLGNSIKDNISIRRLTIDTMELIVRKLRRPEERKPMTEISTSLAEKIEALNQLSTNLNSRLIDIQNLESEVTLSINNINIILNHLSRKKSEIANQLWFPEYPALWVVLYEEIKPRTDSLQSLIDSLQVEIDTTALAVDSLRQEQASEFRLFSEQDFSIMVGYYNSHPRVPYYALLLYITILSALIYMRVNKKRFAKDYEDEMEEATIILKYPFFSSLLIFFFFFWLLMDLPSEVNKFFSIAFLIPLIFMIAMLNYGKKWFKIPLFAIAYLTFYFIPNLDHADTIQRLAMLLIDVALIVFTSNYRKLHDNFEEMNKFWFGILPFLYRILTFIAILGLVANVIGSVLLCRILTSAVLGAVLYIMIIKTMVYLATAFLFLFLIGPFQRISNIMKEDSEKVLRRIGLTMRYVGLISWFYIILNLLRIKDQTFEVISVIFNTPLEVGEIGISLRDVLAFFITIQISFWISRFLRYLLDKEVFPRANLKEGVPNTVSLMIRFTIPLLGIFLAFSAAGLNLDKIALGIGALGVGIGFGLQNIVNNFMSGIILALERPMKIGDFVVLDEVSGIVQDIGLRASTVRTWEGSDVLIPNGELISNRLTNWTLNDKKRRITVEIRVPFQSDTEKLHTLLLEIANDIPEVIKTPPPYINFNGIGESFMDISLFCFIKDAKNSFTDGTIIRKKVYRELAKRGYSMPLPKQDLIINPTADQETDGNPSTKPARKTRTKGNTPASNK